jgi:hypothetical protein
MDHPRSRRTDSEPDPEIEKLQHPNRLLIATGLFCIAAAVLYLALFAWSIVVDPFRTVEDVSYQHPFFTLRPVSSRTEAKEFESYLVRPSSTVFYYRELCLYRPLIGQFTFLIQSQSDGLLVYTLPNRPTTGEVGCFQRSYLTELPGLPPGEYTLKIAAAWRINDWRSVAIVFPDIWFKIEDEGQLNVPKPKPR